MQKLLKELCISKKVPYPDRIPVQMRLDHYLLNTKLITETELLTIYQQYFDYRLYDGEIDLSVVKNYSRELLSQLGCLPLRYEQQTLIVGIDDPGDLNRGQMFLGLGLTNVRYELMTRTEKEGLIKQIWLEKYQFPTNVNSDYVENGELLLEESADVRNAPIVLFLEKIINDAIQMLGSDIHFETWETSVNIRVRVNGVLMDYTTCDLRFFNACSARLKLLANLDIADRRHPQDGRIKWNVNEHSYDLRIAIMPTIYGERIVIRILSHGSQVFDFATIGFNQAEKTICHNLLSKRNGIILVTGPTGSGKTTTLYAFLKKLNLRHRNIITVEDPVEYMIVGTSQVQINPGLDLNFATSLRAILRQDPNIIMIGEIRDEETAEIAIRAAITGHLVLSTLHTNDAIGAISRLIDIGIAAYLVGDALLGVISQRLMRELCPKCKVSYEATNEELEALGIAKAKQVLYQAKGCNECHYTGYIGRFPIFEILAIDDHIRSMIAKHASTDEIKGYWRKLRNDNLWSKAVQMVLNGKTTVKELIELGL